jgi:hypothetical protein
MPNPYLPLWETIPDGEPRVFGDRVYIYGSHDNANSDKFCDYKLKVWSAPLDNLNNWTCHGHIFHTRDDKDHKSETPWSDGDLYAPDVVEKDGKYYLYAYIMGAKGCVGVSDRPEGPFTLLSMYQYNIPEGKGEDCFGNGWFIDPGVLVDDDGKVYIYCGYERSFVAEINPDNMYEIIDSTYQDDIIPIEEPFRFFEACSLRKIKDTYYFIYSPRVGSRLVYATSKSPTGPFEYQGVIVDNGVDYPGGNNHGSICKIKDQWYIFYHRMTNGTVMSRRACVEKIEVLSDGTIKEVEMTSLGFEESLSPYQVTPAELACVLKGGCFITERNVVSRPITAITNGSIIGYKYFDFGKDYSNTTMKFCVTVRGNGCKAKIRILLDDYENGEEIGSCEIGTDDGVYSTVVKNVTDRHAVYFVIEDCFGGWFVDMFKGRHLFEMESFVFMK